MTNVDRTPRNSNLLVWHKNLWLIDHGAALYFHHAWQNWAEQSRSPFAHVKDHVLLPQAAEIKAVDAEFGRLLAAETINLIVSLIPDEWLAGEQEELEPAARRRQVYIEFLQTRLAMSGIFVEEAQRARKTVV